MVTRVCRMWYHVNVSCGAVETIAFGREIDTPVNIVCGHPARKKPPEDSAAYVEQLRETQEVHEFARRPTRQGSARRKRNYHHRSRGFCYKVRDAA